MTRHRDFKALVRERMTKTGERYTAARAQILAQSHPSHPAASSYPGILSGYRHFGGIQSGTAALRNVLIHAGVASPLDGKPHSESLINGLCGGPGFLYAVFEYKDWPPMLSLALRSRSMPDAFIGAGIPRINGTVTAHETTSRTAARKALDAALAQQTAAVCVTDAASLPWTGLPKAFIGGGPHVVAVVGCDGDHYWVDDRVAYPHRIAAEQLSAARAAYRSAKNRLMTIDGPRPAYDVTQALRDAITDTARCYVEPAVPRSFQSNGGFSGLAKWHEMLVSTSDKRGWPTVFSDGARAFAGLQRLYESIECHSAPEAGRALYADFLESIASPLRAPQLTKGAHAYREAGAEWAALAQLVAGCDDGAVRTACERADARLDPDEDGEAESRSAASWESRETLANRCRLTGSAARALYRQLATHVARIIEAERAAVDVLTSVEARVR